MSSACFFRPWPYTLASAKYEIRATVDDRRVTDGSHQLKLLYLQDNFCSVWTMTLVFAISAVYVRVYFSVCKCLSLYIWFFLFLNIFCVKEHADVSYFTCLKTSFCDRPSSFQVCKHLDFLRKFIEKDCRKGEKTCSVRWPTPLPPLTAKPQANS